MHRRRPVASIPTRLDRGRGGGPSAALGVWPTKNPRERRRVGKTKASALADRGLESRDRPRLQPPGAAAAAATAIGV